jgi:predicted lipid-binding transport protein (Tim44 family)
VRRSRRTASAVLVLSLLTVMTLALSGVDEAFARPGGGHSYSGRSSGGGGDGGSSGSGDGAALAQLVAWLIQLTFRYPKVMLPLWGAAGLLFWLKKRNSGGEDWTAGGSGYEQAGSAASERPALLRQELERLRETDPQFSVVVFEDFLQALYARVHEARGAHTLETLLPYLEPGVRAKLEEGAAQLAGVEAVIVGAMSYASVTVPAEPGGRVSVVVDFEANYAEVSSSAQHERSGWYVAERWTLSRAKTARSRPPDQVRSFGCPSCGAPLTGMRDDVCAHCGNLVTSGEFDWRVDAIAVKGREQRGPQLATHAVEVGTLTSTVVDPLAERRRGELQARDPQFDWDAFTARVRHVFSEIQVAWSTPDLKRARPYLSDNLFQTWVYWIEAYRASGLRNVTEGSRASLPERQPVPDLGLLDRGLPRVRTAQRHRGLARGRHASRASDERRLVRRHHRSRPGHGPRLHRRRPRPGRVREQQPAARV